eukprot:m.20018 g.20018  ORF g.20018 m.20018 type:complete len:79 (+) comp27954_c0_seq2:170-406(+)
MESIKKECTPLKRDYDACFLKWFSDKYLKGDQDDDCGDLFVKYQECVLGALKEKGMNPDELKEAVLGTDKEKIPPEKT